MAEEMVSVKVSVLSNLTRRVRTLETENDRLTSYMKVISEAARESQTRSRVYSKREDPPKHKSVHRGNGKPVQGGHAGQVLRGKQTVPVGGVQVPVFNSAPYKPDFVKSSSKIKLASTEMVKKSPH